MYFSTWFMSIVALLVMDVRTGALEQDIQPHRCHQCSPNNATTCDQSQGWLTATCPGARPYCATVAIAPDFATSLGCAAAAEGACSLTLSPSQTLELTCICTGQLCNAPFSQKLRNELLNFSSLNANESALTEAFFKLSNFANVSESALYKAITVEATATVMPVRYSTEVTILSSDVTAGDLKRNSEVMPRAEALKQKATVPPDDDEDENEGSGNYEDSRSHSASAPSAPSSFLPAEENKAFYLLPNLLLPLLMFLYTVV